MEKELTFLQNRRLKQINSIIDALIEFDCDGIPCSLCPLCTDSPDTLSPDCLCGELKRHILKRRSCTCDG